MTLQKKQIYLNKALSKHYKMLRYSLFDKTSISAFKTTALEQGNQSIGISVLTIDITKHKDFPRIIDVTILNGLKKTKKAVVIYEGEAMVPTTLTRSIRKPAQKDHKTQQLEETKNSSLFFCKRKGLRMIEPHNPYTFLARRRLSKPTLEVLREMLGGGVRMHNFKLYFNSQLSLQHLKCLKHRGKVTLNSLDRLAASLILPSRTAEANAKHLETRKERVFKGKEVRLSKTELSSLAALVLDKIHKSQEPPGHSLFNTRKCSNILGALLEINRKIYFISDEELKQCSLAGVFKYSVFNSAFQAKFTKSGGAIGLSKELINSKVTKDKVILLKTKSIEPNIIFFHFLNIAARTYVIYNIKRIFSKLIKTLSLLVFKHPSHKNK